MDTIEANGRKINFKNLGRRKQHKVTLFEITEHHIDMATTLSSDSRNRQSYTEERLTHYWTQAKEYLRTKGFDDTSGHFRVLNGKVIKCDNVGQPLWAAIEERDQLQDGQTGDYLAAVIDHKCRSLVNKWPPTHDECSAILDIAIEIQEFFFRLHLLEHIHPQYSAGKSRTNEANEERNLKFLFGAKAEKIFRQFRAQKPKPSKEWCYIHTAKELNEKYPGKTTPKAGTVKDWFKSRTDLP